MLDARPDPPKAGRRDGHATTDVKSELRLEGEGGGGTAVGVEDPTAPVGGLPPAPLGLHRPRLGRDRRDHQLHQHVEPVGHDRRRPARQEGRREGPDAPSPGSRRASPPARRSSPTTSRTPGSTSYLDQLRFNLVGYGCTTCIGNSGPLSAEISKAIHDDDLVVAAVLSGNRNFEGRINSDVRANYLASPPLVVAYALAGTMDIDLAERPARQRPARASPSTSRTSGRPSARSRTRSCKSVRAEMFHKEYGEVFQGDERWNSLDGARRATSSRGTTSSTYVKNPPYFVGMPDRAAAGRRDQGGAGAGRPGRQHHDRPHLAGRLDQGAEPGGPLPDRARGRRRRLQLLRLAARQPRGDGPGHVRQHPAPEQARPRAPRGASPATCPTAR